MATYSTKFRVGDTVYIPSGRAFLDQPDLPYSGTIVSIIITKTNQFYDVVRDYDSVIERVQSEVIEASNAIARHIV